MIAVFILLAAVTAVVFVRAIYNPGNQKNEIMGAMGKMQKEIFPNGQKDIEQGTKKLLQILNNNIDRDTAQKIFVKSSGICHLNSMREPFTKERLKNHLAPYALHHFDDETLSEFYDFILSKSEMARTMISVVESSREQARSINPNASEEDEMPEGFGEFGLEKTNPIPASSIADGYMYLNRLKLQNGMEISYTRIGSMRAPNIGETIDGYRIFSNDQEIAKIYICPYNKKTSTKAPKGFVLHST